MQELTTAQQLRRISSTLGKPFRLTPYQTLERVEITDDTITVVVRVYKYTETQREVRFAKSGIRMYCWRFKNGRWEAQVLGQDGEVPLTIWDESFKPYIECRYGTHKSVKEYYEQLEWEANTYRPGTKRTPLDSFNRAVWGDTSDEMQEYWTGHNVHEVFTSEHDS